jgi:thiosulfate/3-mercaptopyruvate sulfurtransferase
MVAQSTPDSPIVSAVWLKSHLSAPDVRVLDATWFMPGSPRTGRQAYDAAHIPGSRFFDIDDIADETSALPHMLPPAAKFASRARKLGLGDGHRIICYDQNGYFASARAWWMFRAMGHEDVAVLDGGFEAWRAVGGAIEDLPPTWVADRHFTVRGRADLVRNLEQMRGLVSRGDAQIIDARPGPRFRGEAPEPRPGLRGGHMPGAVNITPAPLLAPDGRLKPPEQLRTAFADAGIELRKPIVNTCGSGVTAAVLALAQAVAGHDGASVYDGSWSEWGAETADTPVETG